MFTSEIATLPLVARNDKAQEIIIRIRYSKNAITVFK